LLKSKKDFDIDFAQRGIVAIQDDL